MRIGNSLSFWGLVFLAPQKWVYTERQEKDLYHICREPLLMDWAFGEHSQEWLCHGSFFLGRAVHKERIFFCLPSL
jgi:hypothetical protein